MLSGPSPGKLGTNTRVLFPLSAAILNEEIAELPFRYVMDQGCEPGSGSAGKLSMGIGGINACIISRPW